MLIIFITYVYLSIILSTHFAATIEFSGSTDLNVKQLREMGKVYLNSKDYKRAAQYYSAVIQTIEGHNGNFYADLRRRCLLTLAECEIRNGNLFHAIARCSEILNECPDPSAALDAVNNLSSLEDHDTDFLQNVMSKAFFRRGISLLKLNKPHLAVVDLNTSLNLKPNDDLIIKELEIATKKSTTVMHDDSGVFFNGSSITKIGDELADLVDDCQINYPRTSFSRAQIIALASSSRARNQLSVSSPQKYPILSEMGSPLQDMFGGMGTDTGKPFPGGGGIMDMFGSGKGGSLGGISNIISLLSSMGVLDPTTASRLEGLVNTFSKIYATFVRIREEISKHRGLIIVVINLLVVIATCFLYSKN